MSCPWKQEAGRNLSLGRYPQADVERSHPHGQPGQAYVQVKALFRGPMQGGQGQRRSQSAMKPGSQKTPKTDERHRAPESKAGDDENKGKVEHHTPQFGKHNVRPVAPRVQAARTKAEFFARNHHEEGPLDQRDPFRLKIPMRAPGGIANILASGAMLKLPPGAVRSSAVPASCGWVILPEETGY